MQVTDIYYLKGVNFHQNNLHMHDLKANFDKILPIVKQTLADQLNSNDNLREYPNPPKPPDAHLLALSLLQEALSIESEHWLWSKLQTDYNQVFPALPHLSNYNRRRKRLAEAIEQTGTSMGRSASPL